MAERVLITGGCSGLGASCVKLYQQRNAHVTVLDCQELPAIKDNIEFVAFDLKKADEVPWPIWDEPFDIVICNAGISVSGDFAKISSEAEQEVMDVNFTGHMRLIKNLIATDRIREGGRIAFICSATRFLSFPIALAYSASKGAMDGFAQALESYLVGRKISVTRVYPGPMNTPHSKYYPGASTEGGRRPEESAPNIVRAIDRRQRQVCPDPISRFYSVASKFVPGVLARKAYTFYQDRLK